VRYLVPIRFPLVFCWCLFGSFWFPWRFPVRSAGKRRGTPQLTPFTHIYMHHTDTTGYQHETAPRPGWNPHLAASAVSTQIGHIAVIYMGPPDIVHGVWRRSTLWLECVGALPVAHSRSATARSGCTSLPRRLHVLSQQPYLSPPTVLPGTACSLVPDAPT
jgi:hypothetical protein